MKMKIRLFKKILAVGVIAASLALNGSTAFADDALQAKILSSEPIQTMATYQTSATQVKDTISTLFKLKTSLSDYTHHNYSYGSKYYEINSNLTYEQLKLVYFGINQYNQYYAKMQTLIEYTFDPAKEKLMGYTVTAPSGLTSMIAEQKKLDQLEIAKLSEVVVQKNKTIEALNSTLKLAVASGWTSAKIEPVKADLVSLQSEVQKCQERIQYLQNEIKSNDDMMAKLQSREWIESISFDGLSYIEAVAVYQKLPSSY
jgi:uncharacterized coiled-coil protein SlyX